VVEAESVLLVEGSQAVPARPSDKDGLDGDVKMFK
jgi:hypothetical protein